jgi:hypothetical protein
MGSHDGANWEAGKQEINAAHPDHVPIGLILIVLDFDCFSLTWRSQLKYACEKMSTICVFLIGTKDLCLLGFCDGSWMRPPYSSHRRAIFL